MPTFAAPRHLCKSPPADKGERRNREPQAPAHVPRLTVISLSSTATAPCAAIEQVVCSSFHLHVPRLSPAPGGVSGASKWMATGAAPQLHGAARLPLGWQSLVPGQPRLACDRRRAGCAFANEVASAYGLCQPFERADERYGVERRVDG